MERVKKRMVKIAYRRDAHVVDYRDMLGVRRRESFSSLREAKVRKALVERMFDARAPIEAQLFIEAKIFDSLRQYRKLTIDKRVGATAEKEKYYFGDLYEYLVNEHKILFVHQITTLHLECFIASLLARKLACSTVNRRFNSYRAWLNKCVTWGSIAKNPIDKISRLAEEPPEIRTCSREQLQGSYPKVNKWLKEVLFFLDQTGRRPIDAGRAKYRDVDEVNQTIKVKSYKGGKTRIIYVQLSAMLFSFIRDKRVNANSEDDFIFLNHRGNPVTTNAIGASLRKAGIRDWTAYGLRHSYANGLVDDGVHARDIQLLMGHAKFETTTRYTNRAQKNLREISEKRAENRKVRMAW